jgi:hypothetical protein
MMRMCKEDRLASGRGGVVVKDDHINEHNTFSNKKQVLAARELQEATLFVRMSDILARTNAEVFSRTTKDPSGVRPLAR